MLFANLSIWSECIWESKNMTNIKFYSVYKKKYDLKYLKIQWVNNLIAKNSILSLDRLWVDYNQHFNMNQNIHDANVKINFDQMIFLKTTYFNLNWARFEITLTDDIHDSSKLDRKMSSNFNMYIHKLYHCISLMAKVYCCIHMMYWLAFFHNIRNFFK